MSWRDPRGGTSTVHIGLILLLLGACAPDDNDFNRGGGDDDDATDDATGDDDDGGADWFQSSEFDPGRVYVASRYQVFGDEHRFVVTIPEELDQQPRVGLPWQDELDAWIREDGRLLYQYDDLSSDGHYGPINVFTHDDGVGYPESPEANDETLDVPCDQYDLWVWRWHPEREEVIGECGTQGGVHAANGDELPSCYGIDELGFVSSDGYLLCEQYDEVLTPAGDRIEIQFPNIEFGDLITARRSESGWLAVYEDPESQPEDNGEYRLFRIDVDGSATLEHIYPAVEDLTDTWLAPPYRENNFNLDAQGRLYRWGEGTDDLLKVVYRYTEDEAVEIWSAGPSVYGNVSGGVRLLTGG